MGLKRRGAAAIAPTMFAAPLRWWHDREGDPLLILAYHRVMPLPDPATYPFDLELISATPEQFEFQMDYLRRNFNPVAMSEVVRHVRDGCKLPPRPVVVTFDDGYDDNLNFAAPIAARHGIVPTIFLATDYVGATEPYWFEWVVYLMMRVPVASLVLEDGHVALPAADDWRSRRRAGSQLQEMLKRLPISSILQKLRSWTKQFSAYVDPGEFAMSGLLGWDQVRRMDAEGNGAGFEFGSHSMSHAVLSNLDDAALAAEMVGSKGRLEQELGHEVPVIAYPVGKEFAYSRRVEDAARAAGYVLGAAYVPGINFQQTLPRFALRRQNIEKEHGGRYFAGMVRFPAWIQ